MAKAQKSDEVQPIIIKKVKKYAAGHHGGAWKVAYADFVTSMMAFFLLLWLLNVSTDAALTTISNYFDPTNPRIAERTSGAGGLMGGLSMSKEGAQVSNVQPLSTPQPTGMTAQGKAPKSDQDSTRKDTDMKKLESALRKRENERFKKAKETLEKAVKENPALRQLAKNLKVDMTPEGLRIQILDQDNRPMFPSGGSDMYPYTRDLFKQVADVVKTMPNEISVRGHTDSHQYSPGAKYTNWELSSDRANASRRVLLENEIQSARIANVMGKADREPVNEKNPLAAENRRITILLMPQDVETAIRSGELNDLLPEDQQQHPEQMPEQEQEDELPVEDESPFDNLPKTHSGEPAGAYQKTPGAVQFP